MRCRKNCEGKGQKYKNYKGLHSRSRFPRDSAPNRLQVISSGVKRREFEASRQRRLEWSEAESDYVNGGPISMYIPGGILRHLFLVFFFNILLDIGFSKESITINYVFLLLLTI